MTTNSIKPFARTSVQMVELNRDFMPSSETNCRTARFRSSLPSLSNTWPRENLQQAAQVDDQRKPVIVAQHADAMGNVFRRLLEQIGGTHRIGANDLIGGDAQAKVVVMLAAERGDNDVLRQESGSAAFGHSNIDERHNRAAQIEDADHVGGCKRQPR